MRKGGGTDHLASKRVVLTVHNEASVGEGEEDQKGNLKGSKLVEVLHLEELSSL